MRRLHANLARVIPIILRPCAWEHAPFASLQTMPRDERPITTWANRDEACLDVAEGVMRVVRELRGEPIVELPRGQIINNEVRVLEVRVHRAFFSGQPRECHFINLSNLSPNRVLEVTHVWYEDESEHIPIIQASRPLPVRLELDQSWETRSGYKLTSGAPPSSHLVESFSRLR